MRCKVGDLAVIVRSEAGNEGKIVQCLRFVGPVTYSGLRGERTVDSWEIDRLLRDCWGSPVNLMPDGNLRPLRDNDGQDETLTWKEREIA